MRNTAGTGCDCGGRVEDRPDAGRAQRHAKCASNLGTTTGTGTNLPLSAGRTTCTRRSPTRPAGRPKQSGHGGPPRGVADARTPAPGFRRLILQRSLRALGFDARRAAPSGALVTP
jgi:hypothetical protein